MTNYRAIEWIERMPGDLYRVGDDGTVWRRWPIKGWKKLKPTLHGNRVIVTLFSGETRLQLGVATLVLTAFVGARSRDFEPCYFPDKDRRNCALSNLRWATRGANRTGVRAGVAPQGRGEDCPSSKLTERDVLRMRKMARKGVMLVEIAERFGVSGSAIGSAVTGRTWKHLPGAVPEVSKNGGNHHRAVVTEREVREIRQLAREGTRTAAIAKIYGMKDSSVWHILRGFSWKNVPGALSREDLRKLCRGRPNGAPKLRELDVSVIRQRLQSGDSRSALARRFGVSVSMIGMIATGKAWKHVAPAAPH